MSKKIYEPPQHWPSMLTCKTLAARLDVSPDYISKLCRCGEIKGKKMGKGWKIFKEDALAFLAKPTPSKETER